MQHRIFPRRRLAFGELTFLPVRPLVDQAQGRVLLYLSCASASKPTSMPPLDSAIPDEERAMKGKLNLRAEPLPPTVTFRDVRLADAPRRMLCQLILRVRA